MDPDANLREQGELLSQPQDRARLRELRQALLEWLTGGGYPPAWGDHPRAASAFFRWQKRRG